MHSLGGCIPSAMHDREAAAIIGYVVQGALTHVMATGVTEVEARWLPEVAQPLIRLSGPLDDPAPHYSAAADAVVATHEATFDALFCVSSFRRTSLAPFTNPSSWTMLSL